MQNPKPTRIDDKAYRASFNGQACIVCGSNYGTVGAHIRYGPETGMTTKQDDQILPLCSGHHAAQHERGEIPFWRDVFTVGHISANHLMMEALKALARERYKKWLRNETDGNR